MEAQINSSSTRIGEPPVLRNGSVQNCILRICGYIGTRIRKDFIGLLREVERKENTKKVYISIKNMGSHPISFHFNCSTYNGMRPMHENSKRFYSIIKRCEKKGKHKKSFHFHKIMGSHPIPFHVICPTYKGISMKPLTHNMYIHIEEQGKPTMIYVMDTQTLAHTQ